MLKHNDATIAPSDNTSSIHYMKNIRILLIVFPLLLAGYAQNAFAQTVVNDFQLINVMSNETVSLGAYSSSKGLVLIFTSNACPYDRYYQDRIAALSADYGGRVPVLLVNSLTAPDEGIQEMVTHGKTRNLKVPYLADKDQVLMSNLNVKKTPEAFLLKNVNGKFTVAYRGAIDDNAQVEADVRHRYLRDAIDEMLKDGKVQTPEVRPVGCNLKKKA